MSRRSGLISIHGSARLAEYLYPWLRRPVVGLLVFAGLLAMTVVFSDRVPISDRGGVASARAADLPALNGVGAPAPGPLDTAMSTAQGRSTEERSASQSVRVTRKTARCAACGVVESVYRSDRPERAVGACISDEWARSLLAVADDDGGANRAVSALGAVLTGIAAEQTGPRSLAALFKHQIVVRLVDGSRVVFNEPTARSLQTGDRIIVIAGTATAEH
jgi:hypothetical protein